MLGRIHDAQLRQEIINVYNRSKDLMDRLNAIFPEYQVWRNASPFGGSEKEVSAAMLGGFEDGIRKRLKDFSRIYATYFRRSKNISIRSSLRTFWHDRLNV